MSKTRGIRTTNIEPNEIVVGARLITVEYQRAVTTAAAQACVKVRGQRGICRVANQGRRATWSPVGTLPPGPHVLVITRIPSKGRVPVNDSIEIPFTLVESKSKPPVSVFIESMVRIAVGRGSARRVPLSEIPRGKYFEIMKARNRKTGAPVALTFNERGQKVDPKKALQVIIQRSLPAGKVHPDLAAKIKKLRASTRVPVAVWLDFNEKMAESEHLKLKNKPGTRIPKSVARERARMAQSAAKLAATVEAAGGSNVRLDALAPVVYADLRGQHIANLQKRPEVKGMFLVRRDGIDDLGDSIAIANSDDVHALGKKGKGIRVAVWERGPDDTSNLSIAGSFDTSATAPTSAHSRLTHAIVKNTESKKPHGHAPVCWLYSANSYDRDALTWAIEDAHCTVVSQSFHRHEEQTEGTLSFDDIYKDWLILHWPYPTIVQASGNDASPDVEYVNHKGYNSLAIGSHDDDASSMAATSVYRNPDTPHADRELPEICANGTGITAVGRNNRSGTSFAAPAVAGIAALLQSTNAVLKGWPEGCRAILLAGAKRNVKGDTWWNDVLNDVDAADGSGAVDALESYRITKSRRSRNATATRRGWDVGTLRSSDFNNHRLSRFTYQIKVPSMGFPAIRGPRRVKVALAWNGKITTLRDIISWLPFDWPIASNLAVDLDLKIYDSNGNQVGYAGSWDNSYEIAEFEGKPGETYTIKIRRWSGTASTWYGIAWTVTGGLYLYEAVPLKRLQIAMRRLGW